LTSFGLALEQGFCFFVYLFSYYILMSYIDQRAVLSNISHGVVSPWRISMADFGLSDVVNISRFGGFTAIIRYCSITKQPLLRDFGCSSWTAIRHRQHCQCGI
jgi:hypothetical protein